ncbi:hypothetical protein D1007_41944 [Hordeum vulgare]|nr:hypothetical protein D1007_41944 [Hordeum vulgare]
MWRLLESGGVSCPAAGGEAVVRSIHVTAPPYIYIGPLSTYYEEMQRSHFKGFRFEAHWLKSDELNRAVLDAWHKEVQSRDPIRVLHTKLSRTAAALRRWDTVNVRWTKFMSTLANEITFRLYLAQEERGVD